MKQATVLVIEDNLINMELVTDLLEMGGYRVLQAENGRKGIEIARSESPDLILMDIGLPDMDGLEATRILKQDTLTVAIPIVVLTAHAMAGVEAQVFAAGCRGFMTKPINTREFQRRIASYVQLP